MKGLSNPQTKGVGKSVRKLESEMRTYGPGSRAIVRIRKGSKGHVFIAENHNGKISYIDPQSNARYSHLNLSRVSEAAVTRLDDQQFSDYAKNAFTRQKV